METPLPDVLEESRRILGQAEQAGVTLRLVGGVAVRFVSPSSTKDALRRTYRDADFVGKASQTKELKGLFADLGYAPRETFNAMQGGRRLIFNDMVNHRRVDIFQDYFEMCHRFDLRKRLSLRKETLPLADLLETKLQVVQTSDKDFRDIMALLIDHELSPKEGQEVIDSKHVASLCAEDWGIYKTFTLTLGKLIDNLSAYPLEERDRSNAEARARALSGAIQDVPKSLRWKVRARVGEKVAWYEMPEADTAVVDSRF